MLLNAQIGFFVALSIGENNMKTNKKVLVVGATGYLGRFIVEMLINENIEFEILARSKEKLT